MNTINLTEEFGRWLSNLKDVMGKAKILARIRNASLRNFGDIKPIGDGV
ncbi:hypothetical protein [Kerstersia gyiorum]|jgi:putative addiction module killer protein